MNYGVVQLKIISPYAICLTKNSSLPEPLTTQVQRLKKEFQHKSFRQIEAALKLQISPRSCADLLKMAQNEKLIAKQGYGKGSHYRTI